MEKGKELVLVFELQHAKIVQAAAKVGLYLYEFCKALEEMKESKAYKSVGYTSFEDYTLRALNIKKSQAYTYLAIADKYSKEFFQSNGKIGITKLQLLSTLSEEEATNFIQEHNIEDLSVKEVKRTLANYQDEKDVEETIDSVEATVEIVRDELEINSFGDFLKVKRLDKGFSLRQFAKKMGIPYTTYRSVENGRRSICNKNESFYNSIIIILNLSTEEIKEMYSWKNREFLRRNKMSPELSNYINKNEIVSEILHMASNNNVSIEIWNKIKKLVTAV